MADIKDPFDHKQEAKKQASTYFPEIPVKQELLIGEDVRLGQRDILPTQIVDRLLGTGAVVLHALNDASVHSGSISDVQHGARGTINHAHHAADIDYHPAGTSLVATDVQAAITELDTNKSPTTHVHAESTITFTDITTKDASTSAHGYAPKAVAPAAGVRNVLAIDNGETIYKNTPLVDSTNPADLAGTASPGTSLLAARRDHVHLGLTSAQLTDLTDGGATTLHKHDHGGLDGLGDDDHTIYLLATGARNLSGVQRYATALARRYYHIILGSANPGASGATWVTAGANTTGGWRLTNASHLIRGQVDVHADWDGATDPVFSVNFMVNIDNSGGGVGDTVDLKATFYYKGVGDTVCKTQVVEVATVVGQSAQYKQFKANFTLDWDAVSNVLETGDILAIVLNLETDTSEVDDVVVTSMEFYYATTHLGIESGDV